MQSKTIKNYLNLDNLEIEIFIAFKLKFDFIRNNFSQCLSIKVLTPLLMIGFH
jgi:hypothetical protein